MSADNGLVIQRNSKGKFVVQMMFISDEQYPDPDKAHLEYDSLDQAVRLNMEAARETEYGMHFNLPEVNDV